MSVKVSVLERWDFIASFVLSYSNFQFVKLRSVFSILKLSVAIFNFDGKSV